jgi:hypothetical protein
VRKNKTRVFVFFVFLFIFIKGSRAYAEEVNYLDYVNASEILVVQNPQTVEDFEKILLYMDVSDTYTMLIPYMDRAVIPGDAIYNANKAFDLLRNKYPEFFASHTYFYCTREKAYGRPALNVSINSLEFESKDLQDKKRIFFETAKETVDDLIDHKVIDLEMNDYDKAKILFEWVVFNTTYDYDFVMKDRQTGYGAMVDKIAVCEGYVSAYNLLLRMVGIKDVIGIVGYSEDAGHIWTRAVLDGKTVYIDPTWGDPRNMNIDYDYFDIDRESLMQAHGRQGIVWWEDY